MIIIDPLTYERKWFIFTNYEQNFFDVSFEELKQYLSTSNYLDLKSMYLYGCQILASIIKTKNAEEIRTLLHLEDDLTPMEKSSIKKNNLWCYI